ncbi:hypothetical protein MLD38_001349 [Melastoma candidum]|uniref:Uncharacterized protein n=1 Tax=Melastoma candidum TaxID=119954 RepID=A0ACB9SCF2_9MYRT|nr:hypothetical protein MLD38_001349 [Melastoma candidum]
MKSPQQHLQTLPEEPDDEQEDLHDLDDHIRISEQDQPANRDPYPDPELEPPAVTLRSGSETTSPIHPIGSPASEVSSLSSSKYSLSRPSSPAHSPPHVDAAAHNLAPPPPAAAIVSVKRSVRDATGPVTVLDPAAELSGVYGPGGSGGEGQGNTGDGGGRRRLRPDLSILRRARRESMMKRGLFVLRVSGCVLCLISLSVLAADKSQGWALDSFYRYKEFRYCLAVNVVGFLYSGFQAIDLAMLSATGKRIVKFHLRHYTEFFLDQVLSYLLLSASSSAATRVDDWESNWGPDKFPQMASVSVGLSIVAFLAFALSSIISGYTLCTLKYS